MKHYYVTAPGQIGCIEEEIPQPGPGEVQVRVTHTAISPGSNVYIYQTGSYTGKWEGKPQECVYKGAGEVSRLGAGVGGLAVGDRTADARLVMPAASTRESADRRCGVAGCAEAMVHHSRR